MWNDLSSRLSSVHSRHGDRDVNQRVTEGHLLDVHTAGLSQQYPSHHGHQSSLAAVYSTAHKTGTLHWCFVHLDSAKTQ